MKTIPVQISDEDHEWLASIAKQRKMTVAQLIEEMVQEASDRAEKETQYLLNEPKLKELLLKGMASTEGIPFEVVREKLGV